MAPLEPGSPAEAGAGRDRQSDRDLTLGRVSDYESGVCKVKKEIPAFDNPVWPTSMLTFGPPPWFSMRYDFWCSTG